MKNHRHRLKTPSRSAPRGSRLLPEKPVGSTMCQLPNQTCHSSPCLWSCGRPSRARAVHFARCLVSVVRSVGRGVQGSSTKASALRDPAEHSFGSAVLHPPLCGLTRPPRVTASASRAAAPTARTNLLLASSRSMSRADAASERRDPDGWTTSSDASATPDITLDMSPRAAPRSAYTPFVSFAGINPLTSFLCGCATRTAKTLGRLRRRTWALDRSLS